MLPVRDFILWGMQCPPRSLACVHPAGKVTLGVCPLKVGVWDCLSTSAGRKVGTPSAVPAGMSVSGVTLRNPCGVCRTWCSL